MKKFAVKVICLVIMLCTQLPSKLFAWGTIGHRVVGEIADSYLTAKTRLQLKKILGNESVAMVSNHADFLKSDTSYKYLDTWHYVNFPKDLTLAQMQAYLQFDTATNAYTKINFIVNGFRQKKFSPKEQQLYLKLLIHFIGDIHQPLHASPVGTTGGNDIKVLWFNVPSNLHRVWDVQLIQFQELSYTEYAKAINFASVFERVKWQKQPLSEWLHESYSIAQLLEEAVEPNQKLSYDYNFHHIATVNERMLKGGVRLAGLLNDLFGK